MTLVHATLNTVFTFDAGRWVRLAWLITRPADQWQGYRGRRPPDAEGARIAQAILARVEHRHGAIAIEVLPATARWIDLADRTLWDLFDR